jgi:ubiquitin carboxyl-terminal hydrolase 8
MPPRLTYRAKQVQIMHLLNSARDSIMYSERLANFRKRDQAYIEYMKAMELIVTVVPRHKDYPNLKAAKGSMMNNLFREVLGRVNVNGDRFDKIKDIIVNDNIRTGVQPRLSRAPTPNGLPSTRPASQQSSRPTSMRAATPHDELFLDAPVNGNVRPRSADFTGAVQPPPIVDSLRPGPPARPPKPEILHGRAIPHGQASANGTSSASLHERLANLRPANPQPNGNAPSTGAPDAPYRMPSPTDFKPNTAAAQLSSRPTGPRSMGAPPLPQKLPLDTKLAAQMPKAPSPTYSPARNMQTPHGINPPRSTARSTVGTGGRSNSVVALSSASSRAPGSEYDSYFPRTNGHSANSQARRKGSVGLPSEGRGIDPEMLFDYMAMFQVLLIDVRGRHDFDQGHIDSPATICIEPLTLRREMTDDQIQDTLILSPDIEQSLFARRDQFDLVVYYDQSSSSTSFLTTPVGSTPEEGLRILFDAMWELYVDKQLKRPPLMLVGGIDGWADLLGHASLRTSNTAATKLAKSQRPTRRPIPSPSPAALLAMERKRRREYNPLDPEEERRWLESARKESVYIPLASIHGEDEEEPAPEEDNSFYRTQEDFLRRYPAISTEQESMVAAPARTEPQYPTVQPLTQLTRVPTYPATAAQSELPSRPAPVAPRFSYSGAHERTVAPYNAHARTTELRPYVSQRDMPHNVRLPKTGLLNFGVTCYMNATIQVLSATLPLTQIFRDGSYANFVQAENWRGSKGLLPPHFANLIHALWVNNVDACRPTTFRVSFPLFPRLDIPDQVTLLSSHTETDHYLNRNFAVA